MTDQMFENLKKELPNIQKDVLLAGHTTFNIGGPATYFLEANNKEDLIKALQLCKKLSLPFFVLGGGSNVLISDEGFMGLTVKIGSFGGNVALQRENLVEAPAGIEAKDLVYFCVENGLAGLEWAGGLPGTFGGAIRGNAGAFGGEMKDSIFSVEALDTDFNLTTFSNQDCQFSYRNSIFKQKGLTIISATLQLKTGDTSNLRAVADSHIAYRNEKHPLEYPSAGSVFKNVDVKKIPPQFQAEFTSKIKQDPFPIVPAAWFIIGAGLIGKQVGQAQISKKHSNYIINLGGAKAKDVLELINQTKIAVKKKYGIELEVEVQYLE